MNVNIEYNSNKKTSPQDIGKLLNEFIDMLNSPKDWWEILQQKQNELENVHTSLKWQWSISHDLYAVLWSFLCFDLDNLKNTVQGAWSNLVKEQFKNYIKSIESCYNKDESLWYLINDLRKTHSDFIKYLFYDNVKNFIQINDKEFFLLAIAENLYKNAEKFTIDKSSINIRIVDLWNYIILSSYSLTPQEFNKKSKTKILAWKWNIISEENKNQQKWQWIYLIDLSKQLHDIWWGISIDSTISKTWWYHTTITVIIPKQEQ